jgi:hypothetical protein
MAPAPMKTTFTFLLILASSGTIFSRVSELGDHYTGWCKDF